MNHDHFTWGQLLGYHPASRLIAHLYNGLTHVYAIRNGPTTPGKYYNVYWMNGQYFVGSEFHGQP